jgi:hypothetical protein
MLESEAVARQQDLGRQMPAMMSVRSPNFMVFEFDLQKRGEGIISLMECSNNLWEQL